MDICCSDCDWTLKTRVKEMRALISEYRQIFRLYCYSDIVIWKRIKKLYNKNWDIVCYDSYELDKIKN